MQNSKYFSFVLPSLKISGGVKETLRLAEELRELGHAVDFVIMWVSLNETRSVTKKFTYLSKYRTNVRLALFQIPIITLSFLIFAFFRIKNAKSRNWVFTHYTTFPLALIVPRTKRFFFVQDMEWFFLRNKYFSALLKRFILFFYCRGEILTANRYLTLGMQTNGIDVRAELPIWADANFLCKECAVKSRVFDYAMVIRKGDSKRLDLYMEFICISNFQKKNWRFAVITPDQDLADLLQPLVHECLVKPSIGQMQDLYARSKYFLMMSDHEGFGLPPLEAMGSGCVPICRDSGGVRAYMIGKLKRSLLPLNSDIYNIIDYADKLQHRNEWASLSSFAKQVFVEGLNKSNNRAELFCSSF